MANERNIYHRLGEPGGPGCQVAALQIQAKGLDGLQYPANLLDAGPEATEVELLRTIALGLGVRWGHDKFGWWAVVPTKK